MTAHTPISFWRYNLILEVSALLVGALILTGALLYALQVFDRYYLERQIEDAGRVSAFLQTHLDDAGQTLVRFTELPAEERSEGVAGLLTAFSDIYEIDSELRVKRIHKAVPLSQVFEGFSLQTGRLAGYLASRSNKGELSEMMRGLEDSRASVYVTISQSETQYLARLDLAYLQEFLTRYGNISRTPLLLVTQEGFVMLSSHRELPVPEIRPPDWLGVPGTNHSIAIDGKRWIPLLSEPTSTGTRVVTLIPTELLETQRRAVLVALAAALAAIAVLFIAKNLRVRQSLITPLTALPHRMQSIEQGSFSDPSAPFTSKHITESHPRKNTPRFRELEEIESRFTAMAEAIRDRESSLVAISAQAQAASQAKSVFLANMSHELRTPLNAVLGLTQFLERSDLNRSDREILSRIHEAGDSLLHIINDILDLSKIEAGEMKLNPRPFSLEEVLQRVHRLLAVQASDKGLEFILTPAPEPLPVLVGDEQRLQQILMNLVGNAIKFTEKGCVSISMTRLDQRHGSDPFVAPSDSREDTNTAGLLGLEIKVRDTGIGIQRQHLADLFAPFHQVENAMTRRFGGTGLGLSISRRLAELMGGGIEVDSEPGQGSEFRIHISFPLADASVKMQDHSTCPTTIGTVRLSGLRLLLVDDSATNRFLLEKILQREGAAVISAVDGAEAIQRLRDDLRPFSAVLMDLQMPVMDGVTAIRIIREELRKTDLPLIAVTAGIQGPQHDAARAAGADAILLKPLDLDRAVSCIQACVGKITAKTSTLARGPEAATLKPSDARPVSARRVIWESTPSENRTGESTDFPQIPGIDQEQAILLTQRNARLFIRLLALFRDEYAGSIETIRAALQEGDHKTAARHLHNLRGSATQIAATYLADLAGQLESAVCTDRTIPAMLLNTLGEVLNSLLEEVKKLEGVNL